MVNATCDTTLSEGDAILNADDLRATGVDGTGVKVGVLSDSYDKGSRPATTAAQDIASDNLPGAAQHVRPHQRVHGRGQCRAAGTDEGRAMMQIVHDLAPGAALDFETAFISEPSFAANITKLADQGASVIVDDVTYFDEPMYQDGIVEQAVTGVRAQRRQLLLLLGQQPLHQERQRDRLLRGRRRLPPDDLPGHRGHHRHPHGLPQLRHRGLAGHHLLLHRQRQHRRIRPILQLGRGPGTAGSTPTSTSTSSTRRANTVFSHRRLDGQQRRRPASRPSSSSPAPRPRDRQPWASSSPASPPRRSGRDPTVQVRLRRQRRQPVRDHRARDPGGRHQRRDGSDCVRPQRRRRRDVRGRLRRRRRHGPEQLLQLRPGHHPVRAGERQHARRGAGLAQGREQAGHRRQ